MAFPVFSFNFNGRSDSDQVKSSKRLTTRHSSLLLLAAFCLFVAAAPAETHRIDGGPGPSGGAGFVLSANLPAAVAGVAYSGAISAAGGTSPYHFTVSDGSLPTGLTLQGSTGAVTGTPSATGIKYFRVTATDARGITATRRLHITVSTTPISTVSVVVSPNSATLSSGATQQFSALVQGTANTAVTWSASAGLISANGLFSAPSVSANTNVTVTAISVADPTKRSSATVTVSPATSNISVAITPNSASLISGNTQQFAATVLGTSNTAVGWSSTAGLVSSAGMFTAPAVSNSTNVTVTARSLADSTKTSSATVTVTPSAPTVSVTVSPNSASVASGNTQQFSATVQGTSNTAVTWSSTAGAVSGGGMFTAPTVNSNTSVTVTATSTADTTKHSAATVVVAPAGAALSITTASTPGAQSGIAYSYLVSASGGIAPYQWSVASGSLPQGFSLSNTGLLSGSTTQTGQFSFTVAVSDAGNNNASKSFSLAVSAPVPPPTGNNDGPAQLPVTYMQSALANTPAPGTTTLVSPGGNLQTALNNANCGDTIQLAAGATFAGLFTLPAKPCDDQHWIIVRTSAPDSSLPPEGTRMTPCYSGVASLPGRPAFNCSSPQNLLAKVVYSQASGSGPFQLAAGANHYRLLGLEISRAPGTGMIGNLISASSGTADHIVLDRVWMHGSPQDDTMAGLAMSRMTYVAMVDSYATDFHCTAVTGGCTDAHVISGGTSTTADGVWRITGNFLEASGENILYGGGAATTTPADIEIRQNHFFKPLTWMSGQPGFVGGSSGNPFIVKNLLELKNAQRVLIEGNIFENSWGGFSQSGYAILLTPKNQAVSATSNVCPICAVMDVTIRYNTISHVGAGISLADILSDNGGAALAGQRYSIHDITIDDVSVSKYIGSGTLLMVFSGWSTSAMNNVIVNHITGFPDAGSRIMDLGNSVSNPPMYAFAMTNSILGQSQYPIWSTGGTSNCAFPDVPLTSLTACFTNYSFKGNAIIATNNSNYPPTKWPTGNYFPTTAAAVQFVNFNGGNGGDYHLISGSPYSNAASDGKDLGADINTIQSLTAGVY